MGKAIYLASEKSTDVVHSIPRAPRYLFISYRGYYFLPFGDSLDFISYHEMQFVDQRFVLLWHFLEVQTKKVEQVLKLQTKAPLSAMRSVRARP